MIYDLIVGLFFGIATVIPGLTGATLLVVFDRYEFFIRNTRGLFKNFKTSFKNIYKIFLGFLAGIALGVLLILKLFEYIPLVIVLVFAGLSVGAVPRDFKTVLKEKLRVSDYFIFLISLMVMIGLSFVPTLSRTINGWLFYFLLFVLGIVATICMLLPGLSGGLVLLLFGLYEPVLNSARLLFHKDTALSSLKILVTLVAGIIIGIAIGVFSVDRLIKKHPHKFKVFTIGALVGTPFVLVFKTVRDYELKLLSIMIPLGILAFILSFLLSYFLEDSHEKNNV